MTTKPRIRKPRKHATAETLDNMILAIRAQVQAFALHLSQVVRDTETLAPQVAAAFRKFREDVKGTKLEFLKLLATKEQLAVWPANDIDAKAPGSPIQSLFNSVEYLLRRAASMTRETALNNKIDEAMKEAAKQARKEAKEQGLKGEEAEQYVLAAQQAAADALTAKPRRVSQDDIVTLIQAGWNSDLDNYTTFSAFVVELLGLKYSEKTVGGIMIKAQEAIVAAQTVEEEPPAPAPEVPAPAPVVHAPAMAAAANGKFTIVRRSHASAA